MSDIYESIATEPDDEHDGDVVWPEEAIRAAAGEVIELAGDGLLAVHDDDGAVSFAVFQWQQGPATKDGKIVDGTKYRHVFHGRGFAGSLRELRHTYWGEQPDSNYIFYPRGDLIADAFAKLRRWFDCD